MNQYNLGHLERVTLRDMWRSTRLSDMHRVFSLRVQVLYADDWRPRRRRHLND